MSKKYVVHQLIYKEQNITRTVLCEYVDAGRSLWNAHEGSPEEIYTTLEEPDVYYKIIGDISEAALSYVRDRDEFDEGDVRISMAFAKEVKSSPGMSYIKRMKDDPEWTIKKLHSKQLLMKPIKVKGPCGHFH